MHEYYLDMALGGFFRVLHATTALLIDLAMLKYIGCTTEFAELRKGVAALHFDVLAGENALAEYAWV